MPIKPMPGDSDETHDFEEWGELGQEDDDGGATSTSDPDDD